MKKPLILFLMFNLGCMIVEWSIILNVRNARIEKAKEHMSYFQRPLPSPKVGKGEPSQYITPPEKEEFLVCCECADCAGEAEIEGDPKHSVEETEQRLVHLIQGFESFRSKPYYCPAGKLTIGYGFTSAKHLKYGSMSQSTAARILRDEIIPECRSVVKSMVKVPLTPPQEAALISFVFNLGEGNLKRLVAFRLNKGLYKETAEAMHLYVKAKVNGSWTSLPGLVKRRKAEASLFLDQEQALAIN